jgi:hypothetical protein
MGCLCQKKDEMVHYEAFTKYNEAFNTYGQYKREEDMFAISCCKS